MEVLPSGALPVQPSPARLCTSCVGATLGRPAGRQGDDGCPAAAQRQHARARLGREQAQASKVPAGAVAACLPPPAPDGVHACSGLHYVAAQGNVDMTRMLCEAGANVNLQDKEGAPQLRRPSLHERRAPWQPSWRTWPAAACVLLKQRWLAGYTPLHMAVGYSFTQTVSVLLEAGADAETPDAQVQRSCVPQDASAPRCSHVLQSPSLGLLAPWQPQIQQHAALAWLPAGRGWRSRCASPLASRSKAFPAVQR